MFVFTRLGMRPSPLGFGLAECFEQPFSIEGTYDSTRRAWDPRKLFR